MKKVFGEGGLKGSLTKKVGPLPVWGWAGVVAGGFLAWRWYQNRNASSSSQQASQPGSAYTADTSGAGYGSGSYPYPIQTRPNPPPAQNPHNMRRGPGGRTQFWHKTGAHSGYWA